MLSFDNLYYFAITSLAIIVVPGPTMMTVMSFALAFGRAVALRAALAVMAASITVLVLAGIGLSLLLKTTPWLVAVLTIASGSYCFYSAIKILTSKPQKLQLNAEIMQSKASINKLVIKNCYLVTVLNPKGHIFFIAFLPQFLSLSQNLWLDLPILALIFATFDCLTAFSYGILAGTIRDKLNHPNFKYVSGIVFIIVGLMAIYYGLQILLNI